jgi:hypothetical protein
MSSPTVAAPLQPVAVQAALDEDRGELPAFAAAAGLQPVGHLVLPVGGLQRVELRGLGDPLGCPLLQLDQQLQPAGLELAGRDHLELLAHPGDPLAQARRWPARRPRPGC